MWGYEYQILNGYHSMYVCLLGGVDVQAVRLSALCNKITLLTGAITFALSGSRGMSLLAFIALSVTFSVGFLGLKLEPSRSPNAASLGLDGTPMYMIINYATSRI